MPSKKNQKLKPDKNKLEIVLLAKVKVEDYK